MRKIVFVAAAALTLGTAPGSAEARPNGCLKYGLGGAVVGHFAGGRRWTGAALGCALGIYKRREHETRGRDLGRSRSVDRNRYDDRGPRTYDRDETGSTGGFGRGGTFIHGGS